MALFEVPPLSILRFCRISQDYLPVLWDSSMFAIEGMLFITFTLALVTKPCSCCSPRCLFLREDVVSPKLPRHGMRRNTVIYALYLANANREISVFDSWFGAEK